LLIKFAVSRDKIDEHAVTVFRVFLDFLARSRRFGLCHVRPLPKAAHDAITEASNERGNPDCNWCAAGVDEDVTMLRG
jgi:hypothetical protein